MQPSDAIEHCREKIQVSSVSRARGDVYQLVPGELLTGHIIPLPVLRLQRPEERMSCGAGIFSYVDDQEYILGRDFHWFPRYHFLRWFLLQDRFPLSLTGKSREIATILPTKVRACAFPPILSTLFS